MNPLIRPYYIPSFNDKTLVFESRFESGNLELAVKVSDNEYNLVLQNDINTAGNTQWFFFRVSNTSKNLSVRFNLLNLGKGDSLFNSGMKVLVYSELNEKKTGTGWVRDGENFLYHPNGMIKPRTARPLYTVTFSYTFRNDKDTVYFAYSYPYTYSDLMSYLLDIENDPVKNSYFSRKLLCHTIGGNRCDYLTITGSEIPEYMKSRKGVVISARVHPGETVSSWMMRGVIDFLLSDSSEAAMIRDKFVVKVIPMLNPDGVVNGSYRCNLAGNDLNRKWNDPCKVLQPTIYSAKRLIKRFAKERSLELLCDLHGHSRQMSVFTYGCSVPGKPGLTREYPLILSKLSANFNYKFCSFRMQKNKESTLRISMFKELEIPNVYTLESSFCGANGVHFSQEDLMEMGKNICLALLISQDLPVTSIELAPLFNKSKIKEELENNEELLQDCEIISGSDSEPSEDNLDEESLKLLLPVIVKKKKKKRKQAKHSKESSTTFRKKKSESLPLKNEKKHFSYEKRLERSPDKRKFDVKVCLNCGEKELPGHNCKRKMKNFSPSPLSYQKIEKLKPTSYTSFATYFSPKGKKVRDQATQTMYVKKALNEIKSIHSAVSIAIADRFATPERKKLENIVEKNHLKQVVENDEFLLPNLKGHVNSIIWNPDKYMKLH